MKLHNVLDVGVILYLKYLINKGKAHAKNSRRKVIITKTGPGYGLPPILNLMYIGRHKI